MAEAIGNILSPAVGVALSPLPIVGVILILFSPMARRNSPAFVAGWAIGLTLVGTIILAIKGPTDLADSGGEASTSGTAVNLALGLVLILLAIRSWRGRPKEGETARLPKWMRMIEDAPPVMALWLGISLSAMNPKNLMFAAAAATAIAQANVSIGAEASALAIFVVLASITVAGPVIWYLLQPDAASAKLAGLKNWLTQSNATVMAVVLFVLGMSQLGKGIGGLS